ncbi:hypothetical protein, partial [Angelakisella massiliensis]|uniref:hypothetical protein n=1 Tax=Angelakisella massiliensis TaxID=1871018 RepID=UPI0024B1FC6D
METGKRKTTAKGHGGRYGQSSKINLAHLLSIGMKLSLFTAAVRGKRAWGAAMSAKQPFAFKESLDLSAKKRRQFICRRLSVSKNFDTLPGGIQ